jgi:uncharacterized protein YbjT (DUF2867 family)
VTETGPTKNPERVLVAGATGYLGRHLITQLKQDGCWVRALARRAEQAETLADADEVFIGEATRPETLSGVADGVDAVYSALGITRQRDGMSYQDVDYRGNLNLLRQAEDAGVDRFVYVSVLHGPELRRTVRLAEAKERFVDALTTSSIRSVVVRPTGYFSDMNAFLDMARRGTVYLFGDGQCRMNPISGSDLARACVAAAGSTASEVAVGGPDVFTHDEIARAAFAALGTSPRIRHVPVRLVRSAGWAAAHVTAQQVFGPLQFLLAVMTNDMVAPTIGTDHLAAHFHAEAARASKASVRAAAMSAIASLASSKGWRRNS